MIKQSNHHPKETVREPLSFIVKEPALLLPFLFVVFPDKSRTTVKALLAHRQVAVNGTPTTQFDVALNCNDKVSIRFDGSFKVLTHPMLKPVYEDDYLIVVNKASGLLTVGTDSQKEKTAYRIVSNYLKQDDPASRVFVLHRLDKDTSGLLMFAKSQQVQSDMQWNWDRVIIDRKYVAVIEGTLDQEKGEVSSYLSENSVYKVYSSNAPDAKFALTRYRVLKTNGQYSLVELDLATGRKNQIRVHMEQLGHSILGDRKYGAKSNPLRRMALHACKLHFVHPVTNEELCFETPIPTKFQRIVRRSPDEKEEE